MKGDFSRWTFNPQQPYSSVRMQQGRVPLDADWNEQVDIDDYLRRRAFRDIIGDCCIPASVPDSFRVSIADGEVRVEGGRAWVQGKLAERAGAQTLAFPANPGRYAVYLEVFERHVTAIEDPSIREIALGGPDTATRTRTVCRAGIAPVGANQHCADLGGWIPSGQTTGQLTASTGAQPPDTPCVVPAAAGYARLENQLYRVEIQRSGEIGGANPPSFKWSRENGSIAAAWLGTDGDEIIIASAGRDDVLGFHENRWVELSHDALDLSGETGPLVEVTGRRTDSQGRFRLQFDAHGQALPDPSTVGHPKVRRWDHDSDSDPNLGGIPIPAANTPIALEGGIEVEFGAGFYRNGDYWFIPARTFSGNDIGDILWPRDGGGNPLPQPPHGVERLFCRLAILSMPAGAAPQVADDCRRMFPSLCGIEHSSSCCTVTVGSSGGDVATIAEALGRLPQDGGVICILPGLYRERVVLDGRRNVTIHGCGGRTRIVAPDANPVFSLRRAEDIRIHTLSVESPEGHALSAQVAARVTIEDVDVVARDRSAVLAVDLRDLSLLDCRIGLQPLTGQDSARNSNERQPAVFLAGNDLRIERNMVVAIPFQRGEAMAAGGIQIGGGSERVQIRRNRIDGGTGPGIILGSVSTPSIRVNFNNLFDSLVARNVDTSTIGENSILREGASYYADLSRQPNPTRFVEDTAAGFFALRPVGGRNVVSDGDLTDIRILANEVRNMGGSGITAAHFFDLLEGQGDFISIHGLEIAGNRIEDCLRIRQQPVPQRLAEDSAIGGIVLSDVDDLVIRDNTIDRNGAAARNSACGIFVLHSSGLEIHRNRIRHNGASPQSDPNRNEQTLFDRRGGIVVGYAEVPTREVQLLPTSDIRRRRQDGTPAARIQDNIVIAPEGRAIEMIALGSVVVLGNQLTALGADFRSRPAGSPLGLDIPENSPLNVFTNALGGAVVSILNLGASNELYFQLAGFSGLNMAGRLAQPAGDTLEDRPVLAGGNIQFSDNQVVLDALDGVSTFILSAISLFTLDDLNLSDNQSDSDLALDIAILNTLAFGFSLRATSNRFKQGLQNALYSAMTIAFLNTTTGNQGTHCFVRIAPVIPASHENTVLVQRIGGGERACIGAAALEERLLAALFAG